MKKRFFIISIPVLLILISVIVYLNNFNTKPENAAVNESTVPTEAPTPTATPTPSATPTPIIR